ncbi:MAG: pirin-like C-terminal cupin domain-containing protein [Pseudomonadota bacterium]
MSVDGAQVRVLIGQAFGQTSPVKTFAPTIYLDVQLQPVSVFELPALAAELALYSIDHDIEVDGEPVAAHTLVLLAPGQTAHVCAPAGARLMVLGGDALDGHRLIWWNFVSSRKERLVQAGEDWAAQTMGQVPGETEFIPLPERRIG